MDWKQFTLRFMHEGKDWIKLILPALLAWHAPQPRYMKRRKKEEG